MMKNLKFNDNQVSLTLSTPQCANIAQACTLAAEKVLTAERYTWRTLGMMFEACAMTGYAQLQLMQQGQISPPPPAELDRGLMQYLQIENGEITLTLSLAQCADISDACNLAADMTTEETRNMSALLANLFEACVLGSFITLKLGSLNFENKETLDMLQGADTILREAM